MLFRMTYASRALTPPGAAKSAVAAILAVARRHNARAGVTGAMAVLPGGQFLQVLEGPLAALRALHARIEQDPRHTDLRLLEATEAAERMFADEPMGFAGWRDGPVAGALLPAGLAAAGGGAAVAAMLRAMLPAAADRRVAA